MNGSSVNLGRSSNNDGYRKPAVAASIIFAIIVLFIGIFLFTHIYTESHVATVTNVNLATDRGEHYETYDFVYVVNGRQYTGHGDDDLLYYYSDNNFEYSVKVGEKYTIYTDLLNPSNYQYESHNGGAFLVLFVALGIAALIIGNTINNLKLYKKRLESIGDLNGDGKIDEKDLEIYLSRMNTMGDKKEELQNRVCPYCDSLVPINDRFCKQCGAALGKMDK